MIKRAEPNAVAAAARTLGLQRGSLIARARYLAARGLVVADGPFAGLRFPPRAIARVPSLTAYLAGAYEYELREAIDASIASSPAEIVNIGAGDGFYAAGLARRCPEAELVAFEADPAARRLLGEVLELNRVTERVEVLGMCTVEALGELSPAAGTLVVCDCEGAEETLIDPEAVPWLRDSPMIVECHESFVPGVTEGLRSRLASTHRVVPIAAEHRALENHPLIWDLRGLSVGHKEALISEMRPWTTNWLWAQPL